MKRRRPSSLRAARRSCCFDASHELMSLRHEASARSSSVNGFVSTLSSLSPSPLPPTASRWRAFPISSSSAQRSSARFSAHACLALAGASGSHETPWRPPRLAVWNDPPARIRWRRRSTRTPRGRGIMFFGCPCLSIHFTSWSRSAAPLPFFRLAKFASMCVRSCPSLSASCTSASLLYRLPSMCVACVLSPGSCLRNSGGGGGGGRRRVGCIASHTGSCPTGGGGLAN